MSKSIYIAFLDRHTRRPNLIKVFVEKETEKIFKFDRSKHVHVVGNDTQLRLYGRQFHKLDCDWRRTAQEALELLRELTAENVRIKKNALETAKIEHGYVTRVRLAKEERGNE